tara:strand:- start:421 stop:1830 length:1410 start_codon:yes stop_codon:yes gene_type:complete
MITTTLLSKKILDTVFESTDLYHCNNFEPSWALTSYGRDYKLLLNGMRFEHLYSTNGFVNSINHYCTEPSRVIEFMTYNDQPSTLRHRLNMIDTLISSDMKTNLPTHISIAPKFQGKVVDIQDLFHNPTKYQMIVHPGFTRMNGAIFLNTPLRNVLIHINKAHNVQFAKHPSLQKINSNEELFKFYKPFTDKDSYRLDFFVPNKYPESDKWTADGIKYHEGTKTPVLKCNSISTEPYSSEAKDSVHPSDRYACSTFDTLNSYCNTLFSNKIKVYNPQGTASYIHKLLTDNIINFSTEFLGYHNAISQKIIRRNDNREQFFAVNSIHGSKNLSEEKISFYKRLTEPLREFHNKRKEKDLPYPYMNHRVPDYINDGTELEPKEEELIKDIKFLKTLVEKNKFKGILVIFSRKFIEEKTQRTFSEILMCMSPTSAITRKANDSVILINCNHEFWTTGANYTNKIIPKSFFNI